MAQPATVLILAEVDDADRVALVAACTDAGYAPTVEPSAEIATTKLGQKRFDALVVHMGTPGGALACMRARGKLLRLRVPVLALADTEDDAAFARAYRAGADEVLLLARPAELTERLRALPKPSIPQPGNARGDAVVADADRTRGEVLERVLRDAGFRVEVVVDGFAARLQAGRPALKVAVVDASLDDIPTLITQARAKGARCAWVVRARPEVLDELRRKLAPLDRVAVVSAYGPPDDVLFETNRMLEPRPSDGRADPRLLHGTIVRLVWPGTGASGIGYTYNVSPLGLFVRTVVPPAAETVTIEVSPPGSETKIRLEGRVVWRREFGTTRKEPVPAGFGVQITGGDIGVWAEACPKAPSLRHPMPEEPRTSEPPRKPTPIPAAIPSQPPLGLVAPGDIDIQPREPQSSVEEMLASVLSETIPGDEPGATPLSIHGGSVVELKAREETEETGAAAPAAPIAARAAPAPAAPAPVAPAAPAPEIESHDITPASLGFLDAEEGGSVAGGVPDRQQEGPAAASVADASDATLGTSDTIPAPSLASAELAALALGAALRQQEAPRPPQQEAPRPPQQEAPRPPQQEAPRSPQDEDTAPPARVASVSSVPPSSKRSESSELRVPTQGASPLVWLVVAAVVIGGAVALLIPRRGTEPPPRPVAVTKAAPTAAPEPVSAPAPSAAPEVPASAPPTAPSAVASAEPSVVASAPPPASAAEPAPSAPPAAAVDTAPPATAAPAGAGAEASPADLASLPKGQGFLLVASPLATNVYVYGLLAGTTNERLTTKCGPRFLRLGTKPGAWQSEGVVQIVKCGALTRVEMGP